MSAIPMRLNCPTCGALHIDEGEFATKVHHTHACQECGNVWRPAIVATVGVRFLPGFRDSQLLIRRCRHGYIDCTHCGRVSELPLSELDEDNEKPPAGGVRRSD